MFIYLLCLLSVVSALVKPVVKCDKNVDILQDRVRLTSLSHNDIETMCHVNGTVNVPSSTFFQVERTYTLNKYGAEMSESIMGIGVYSIGKKKLSSKQKQLFDIIIHNDRITLDIEDVNTDKLFCMSSFAAELPRQTWILVRLTPLPEQQKTMISINAAPLGSQTFRSCIVYEYKGIIKEHSFTLHGITKTGMDQDVLKITHETPFKTLDYVQHEMRKIKYKLKNAQEEQKNTLSRQWLINVGIMLLFISVILYGIWKIKKLQKKHFL